MGTGARRTALTLRSFYSYRLLQRLYLLEIALLVQDFGRWGLYGDIWNNRRLLFLFLVFLQSCAQDLVEHIQSLTENRPHRSGAATYGGNDDRKRRVSQTHGGGSGLPGKPGLPGSVCACVFACTPSHASGCHAYVNTHHVPITCVCDEAFLGARSKFRQEAQPMPSGPLAPPSNFWGHHGDGDFADSMHKRVGRLGPSSR